MVPKKLIQYWEKYINGVDIEYDVRIKMLTAPIFDKWIRKADQFERKEINNFYTWMFSGKKSIIDEPKKHWADEDIDTYKKQLEKIKRKL